MPFGYAFHLLEGYSKGDDINVEYLFNSDNSKNSHWDIINVEKGYPGTYDSIVQYQNGFNAMHYHNGFVWYDSNGNMHYVTDTIIFYKR